jgi:hypothetical protein
VRWGVNLRNFPNFPGGRIRPGAGGAAGLVPLSGATVGGEPIELPELPELPGYEATFIGRVMLRNEGSRHHARSVRGGPEMDKPHRKDQPERPHGR